MLTKNYYKSKIFSIASISFVLFVIVSLGSCARKMTFGVSPVVPAATGKVKIKKSKNDNYVINVKVLNLAPANRLSPSRELYVVWMQTDRSRVKNIGMIKSSKGFLSNKFKGDMTATSIEKPTEIFITAEDNGNVSYPGSQVVLKTE
ncbi:MAG: hypothetical protein ABI237_17425 [Ginsengibacter sp.]